MWFITLPVEKCAKAGWLALNRTSIEKTPFSISNLTTKPFFQNQTFPNTFEIANPVTESIHPAQLLSARLARNGTNWWPTNGIQNRRAIKKEGDRAIFAGLVECWLLGCAYMDDGI